MTFSSTLAEPDYTDFDQTGLPDTPEIRKAHAVLLRILSGRLHHSSGWGVEDDGANDGGWPQDYELDPHDPDYDPDYDVAYDTNGETDGEWHDEKRKMAMQVLDSLVLLRLAQAVGTARVVNAHSAMDDNNLVAAALLLDCVEDDQAMDLLIQNVDEMVAMPIVELDQLAMEFDTPILAIDEMSESAKVLVLANAIQEMIQLESDLVSRRQGGQPDNGQWRIAADHIGEVVDELYALGERLQGNDAGLDSAFVEIRARIAQHLLDENKAFFAPLAKEVRHAFARRKPKSGPK